MDEDAKGLRRIAKASRRLLGRGLVDDVSAERFVETMGGVDGLEEVVGEICYLVFCTHK
jgi:hypothetical protein